MDFRPGCHRVQRQVQFREQTNCYEGSRVLYTHMWASKSACVRPTLAGHLRLRDISTQGWSLVCCHLVGVPEVEVGQGWSLVKVGPWSDVTWLEYQKSRQVALSPFSLSHSVSGRSSTWQPILFLSPPRSNQTGGWIMFPWPLTSTKLLETKTKKWSIMLSFAPCLLFCPVLLTLTVISCSTLKHSRSMNIKGTSWSSPSWAFVAICNIDQEGQWLSSLLRKKTA